VKKVAIIILNWLGWRDTIECLSSLKKLDYPNYRLVVVDNASSDDSVAQIQSAYPDIPIIVNKRNLGFGSGCNVAIRQALQDGTDFVWLLNNDTIADPRALTALVEKAESDLGIGAIGSVLYYMDEPDRVQAWGGGYVNYWRGESRHHLAPATEPQLHYLTAASLLLRREALKQVGLFDEKFFLYWEDVDLGCRLRNGGWKLAVAEGSRVWHKESASLGERSSLTTEYFNTSAVRFFRKHARFPAFPIAFGVGAHMVKLLLRADWNGIRYLLKGAMRKETL